MLRHNNKKKYKNLKHNRMIYNNKYLNKNSRVFNNRNNLILVNSYKIFRVPFNLV